MGIKSKPNNPQNSAINNNDDNNNNNNNNNVIGKGKVTPFQVAFIVDRYLADNNFSQTRSAFRSEASSFISKSSLNQAPKSLLSLGELLDEYIWLKEQKVLIEQEQCGLAQERCRIQTLLQGMQSLMNSYNSAAAVNCLPLPQIPVLPLVSPPPPMSIPVSSSNGFPASRTPLMTSVTTAQSVNIDHANFKTPISGGRPPRKRRINYKDLEDAPQTQKKLYCGPLANYPFSGKTTVGEPSNPCSSMQSPPVQSSSPNFVQGSLLIQGSSVAKSLFDQHPRSPTSNSSIPKTPPRAVSSPSDKSTSPVEDGSPTAISHRTGTPPETTPTNCTFISSKTVIVSPSKRYSIERNECTFSSPVKVNSKRPSKRDHVKGRLDFNTSDVPSSLENVSGDGSTASESEKEGETFDLDLPNFDVFGPDFSLSELLTDFGIGCEILDYSGPTTACTSIDAVLESVPERDNGKSETNQDLTERSPAVAEVLAGDKTVDGIPHLPFTLHKTLSMVHLGGVWLRSLQV
ncbi:hypothetical protein KSS87_011091 [Heliosperma pusillum]|nr:hypothetical protein KSS87_011091 [Heliosperma pusillum]